MLPTKFRNYRGENFEISSDPGLLAALSERILFHFDETKATRFIYSLPLEEIDKLNAFVDLHNKSEHKKYSSISCAPFSNKLVNALCNPLLIVRSLDISKNSYSDVTNEHQSVGFHLLQLSAANQIPGESHGLFIWEDSIEAIASCYQSIKHITEMVFVESVNTSGLKMYANAYMDYRYQNLLHTLGFNPTRVSMEKLFEAYTLSYRIYYEKSAVIQLTNFVQREYIRSNLLQNVELFDVVVLHVAVSAILANFTKAEKSLLASPVNISMLHRLEKAGEALETQARSLRSRRIVRPASGDNTTPVSKNNSIAANIPPPVSNNRVPDSKPPLDEPQKLSKSLDISAQVKALKIAAKTGKPFCEECTRVA